MASMYKIIKFVLKAAILFLIIFQKLVNYTDFIHDHKELNDSYNPLNLLQNNLNSRKVANAFQNHYIFKIPNSQNTLHRAVTYLHINTSIFQENQQHNEESFMNFPSHLNFESKCQLVFMLIYDVITILIIVCAFINDSLPLTFLSMANILLQLFGISQIHKKDFDYSLFNHYLWELQNATTISPLEYSKQLKEHKISWLWNAIIFHLLFMLFFMMLFEFIWRHIIKKRKVDNTSEQVTVMKAGMTIVSPSNMKSLRRAIINQNEDEKKIRSRENTPSMRKSGRGKSGSFTSN